MRVVMITPTGMAREYDVRHVRFDTKAEALSILHAGKIAWVKPEVAEDIFRETGMTRHEYVPS